MAIADQPRSPDPLRGVPLNGFPENGSRRSALPPRIILIFLILIFSTPWILLFQRSGSLPCLASGISMLCISILDGALALHLVVGGGSGRDCPSPEQSRPSTMHLSGAWTDEASANSCNPCDRVSRGHSVGFTQFAVTADRTPRIFANAMSSCGFGYPLLASLERRDL